MSIKTREKLACVGCFIFGLVAVPYGIHYFGGDLSLSPQPDVTYESPYGPVVQSRQLKHTPSSTAVVNSAANPAEAEELDSPLMLATLLRMSGDPEQMELADEIIKADSRSRVDGVMERYRRRLEDEFRRPLKSPMESLFDDIFGGEE